MLLRTVCDSFITSCTITFWFIKVSINRQIPSLGTKRHYIKHNIMGNTIPDAFILAVWFHTHTPTISKIQFILLRKTHALYYNTNSQCIRIFRSSTKFHLIGVFRHKGRNGVEFACVNYICIPFTYVYTLIHGYVLKMFSIRHHLWIKLTIINLIPPLNYCMYSRQHQHHERYWSDRCSYDHVYIYVYQRLYLQIRNMVWTRLEVKVSRIFKILFYLK